MVILKKSNSERTQDPAFKSVGQRIGKEIWRIENFQLVPLRESDHGKFYSGDSYIVLRTSASRAGAYVYDIHFWIGKHSTQDEYGTAAIKVIELGEILGGRVIQHREIQGHESNKFLSCFKPCIVPLEGGFASGFKRHESKYVTRLFVCRGNRVVRMNQVPVELSSLNHDDIFILDTESKIYQFNGKTSSIQERAKALEVIPYLKDKFHRGRRCPFAIVDDEDSMQKSDLESREFWAYFGGFAPIAEKAFDENELIPEATAPMIYCIKEGQMKLEGSMSSNEKLESNKCYLLDCGTELFLWVGRLAPVDNRTGAIRIVKEYVERENRSNNTCITRLVQGYETSSFKSKFDSWSRSSDLINEESFGVKGNSTNAPLVEEAPQLLEGGGKLEVWRIDESDKKEVSKEEMGNFYCGDCYIVLYTYQSSFKEEEYFLACWIGKNSAQGDQNVATQLTNSMWDALQGIPVQGRIYEGKEPPQFIALFQPMIVLKGGISTSYKKLIEEKKIIDRSYSSDGMALIQIPSTSFSINKTIQVDAVVESLCSSDCFLLQAGDSIYAWHGNSSTVEQQQLAEKVAKHLKPASTLKQVKEGQESSSFWSFLHGRKIGGKKTKQRTIKDPHLFSFSFKNRKLEVSEIYNFSQEDLLTEDMLIFDTHAEVFVWIGRTVDPKEKKQALDIGKKYIEQAIRLEGLSPEVPLYRVTEGNEPCFFTSYFSSWDVTKAMIEGNSFEKKLKLLKKIARTFTMLSREKAMRYRKPSAKWTSVQSSFKNIAYSPKLPIYPGSQSEVRHEAKEAS